MRASHAPIAITVGIFSVGIAMSVGACKKDKSPSGTASSVSLSPDIVLPQQSAKPQPTMSGAPIAIADVQAALNPLKHDPYDGPTGIVEGTVRMTGDPPPDVALRLPPECMGATGTYGRLFREGKDRAAADVLVAITGYEAYLPVKEEAVYVQIERCAFSARTFTMTFGQRMEVQNLDDKTSFIPVLHGSRYTAFNVALPKGDPVKLYPHRVGQYELADNMDRRWMSADVFVLKFRTHHVTDIDGRFRIEGIPVGEVEVNALLPAIDVGDAKKVTVNDGEVTQVDFTLKFDKETYDGKTRPRPLDPAHSGPRVPIVK